MNFIFFHWSKIHSLRSDTTTNEVELSLSSSSSEANPSAVPDSPSALFCFFVVMARNSGEGFFFTFII